VGRPGLPFAPAFRIVRTSQVGKPFFASAHWSMRSRAECSARRPASRLSQRVTAPVKSTSASLPTSPLRCFRGDYAAAPIGGPVGPLAQAITGYAIPPLTVRQDFWHRRNAPVISRLVTRSDPRSATVGDKLGPGQRPDNRSPPGLSFRMASSRAASALSPASRSRGGPGITLPVGAETRYGAMPDAFTGGIR
jgi:hypothetical protein